MAVISEPPQSVPFGQPVRLDGSESYNNTRDIRRYAWDLNGLDMGSEAVYPDYVLPFGTLTIGLTVFDQWGRPSPRAERTITVVVDLEQLITAVPESEHAPSRVQLSSIDLANNDFDKSYEAFGLKGYEYLWSIEPGVPETHILKHPGPFETVIMPGPNKIRLRVYSLLSKLNDEPIAETTVTASVDPDSISMHDNRVVVMNITNFENRVLDVVQDNRESYTGHLRRYASRAFYSRFEDDFDFLMLMPYF